MVIVTEKELRHGQTDHPTSDHGISIFTSYSFLLHVISLQVPNRAHDKPHGWGSQYMRNGNVAQGAVVNGTFEGQGLHFRWGDGTVFKCKDLTICFENNRLVRANGTFSTRKSNSRRRNRRKNGRIVEFDDGWTVGGTIYFLNGDVRFLYLHLESLYGIFD